MPLSICFFLLLSFLSPQGYPMDTPENTGQHFHWRRLPTVTAQEFRQATSLDPAALHPHAREFYTPTL